MKHIFRLILLFLLLQFTASGQQVIFCESVNDNTGEPYHASSYFIIGSNGGSLMMLLKLSDVINSNTLKIDVFKIDEETKKEVFNNTINANPQPHFTWIKKEIEFYLAGEYVVYVYDAVDRLIGVGKVRIVVS